MAAFHVFRVTMIILGTLGCTHGGNDFKAPYYYVTITWRRLGINKTTYKQFTWVQNMFVSDHDLS